MRGRTERYAKLPVHDGVDFFFSQTLFCGNVEIVNYIRTEQIEYPIGKRVSDTSSFTWKQRVAMKNWFDEKQKKNRRFSNNITDRLEMAWRPCGWSCSHRRPKIFSVGTSPGPSNIFRRGALPIAAARPWYLLVCGIPKS